MESPGVKNFTDQKDKDKLKHKPVFNMNSEANLDIVLPPTATTTTSSQT